MSKGLEHINKIKDVLEEIGFNHNEIKIDDSIYDKFYIVENELKTLEIIKKKCIYNDNIHYVRISDNYSDYLLLSEDKIEERCLLTKDEFYVMKEVLSYE